MVLNFIALVLGIFAAIWQNYQGNVGYCLMNIAVAVINLPFAIKWIAEYFG